MSKHSIVRWIKMIGAYLLVAAVAALGWLWCTLPEQVYLEPEQPLMLPRFGWVEPLRGHGSRNVASTRAAGVMKIRMTSASICRMRAAIRLRWRWAAGCRSRPSAPP